MKPMISILLCSLHMSLAAQNGPQLVWKFSVDAAIVSSPVIDDTVVYVASLDKNLYAINVATGKEIWRFTTGGPNRGAVLIKGAFLYFVSGDGSLYCLDKKTSARIWAFRTGGESKYSLYGFADHFQSSPVWDNGLVYFGSGDKSIYAVGAQTGQQVWKFETGGLVHSTPAIQGNKLMAGSFDGYFYALDKSSGKLIWKFKSIGQRYFPLGEFQGPPAVYGGTVYIGSRDFNLYAVDIDKGNCNWNRYFSFGWAVSTPAFFKNMVISGTSDDRAIFAMDTARGTIIWKFDAGFNIFGGCLVDSAVGYFGTISGRLYAINLNDGSLQWSFETDGRRKNHDIYLTKEEKYNAYSISLLKKDLAEQVPMYYRMGGIFSKPAIKGNHLVCTSSEGSVYCLALP